LPKTNNQEAQLLANKICKTIRENYIDYNSEKLKYTVSIGVATHIKGKELDFSEIINNADKAMYNAKNKGKNTVEIYLSSENMAQIQN